MVPLWVYDHPEVTGTVMGVYLALAALSYDRSARSSVADVVERSGLKKSAVYDALRLLERIGATFREGPNEWFLPLDDSATAENPSATAEKDSATAEYPLSRALAREVPEAAQGAAGGEGESKGLNPDEQFDRFWARYPKRDGRKIGKRDALAVWRRMSLGDRRSAWRAAGHYAEACEADVTRAADAHRWLTKRRWEDWGDAVPLTPPAGAPRGGSEWDAQMDALRELNERYQREDDET